MKNFCIIGRPIKHSKSPFLYNYLFNKFNISANYKLMELEKLDLESFNFLKNNFSGFNITSPFKEDVLDYIDVLSDEVKKLKACNLVIVKNGLTYGYNTDYFGFYNYFKSLELKDLSSIYILGTGGAAKVCYHVLKDLNYNPLFVSRTKKDLNCISYNELNDKDVDLVINATPLGMDNKTNPINFHLNSRYAIDLIYNPFITPFLKFFNSTYNGLDMFVYQAIKSFNLFGYNNELSFLELKDLVKKELV